MNEAEETTIEFGDNSIRPLKINLPGPLIRIGSIPLQIAVDRADWVLRKLRHAKLPFHFVPVPVAGFDRHTIINKDDYYASEEQVNKLFDAIISGQIEMGVIALPELPSKLPPGIRIAALTEIIDSDFALVSLANQEILQHDFLGVYSFSLARQVRSERTAAHYEQRNYNFEQALMFLRDGRWNGVILPFADLKFANQENDYTVEVLPRQRVVPVAGQGGLAVLVSDKCDELAASVFTHLHSLETEKIYKIECEIAKLLSSEKERAGSCIWLENNDYFMSLYNPHLDRPFQRWSCKPISEGNGRINKQLCYNILNGITGNVHLIGIGSGAPKQLTIQAENLLRRTELVICHAAESEQLFYLLPAKCQILDMDSDLRFHRLSFLLEQIILAWRKGFRIAVLLRGDAYLLSDGGVLAQGLVEQRIPFQLTPGIAIGITGPALAGVPLLFPGRSAHAHFYYGTDPMLNTYDFKSILLAQGTLVYYVTTQQAIFMSEILLKQGCEMYTSAMFLSRPGHPEQICMVATLADLGNSLYDLNPQEFGLFVVGEVVRAHEVLNKTDIQYKPLLAKSILIPTINNVGDRELAWQSEWEDQGAHIIQLRLSTVVVTEHYYQVLRDIFNQIIKGTLQLPTIVVPVNKSKERIKDKKKNIDYIKPPLTWLAFLTSEAVDIFFTEYLDKNHDLRQLNGCAFAAVSEDVSRTLANYGIQADYISATQIAEDMAKDMKKFIKEQDQVLIFRGTDDSEMPEMILNLAKIRVRGVPIYQREHRLPPAEQLLRLFDQAEYLAFATVTAVNPFAQAMVAAKLGHDTLRSRPIKILAANSDIKEALIDRGFSVHGDFSCFTDL